MKTITLTAEEMRWLSYQLETNPCRATCVVHLETGHYPRNMNCFECRFSKAIYSIEKKLLGKGSDADG